ncbi:MAG: hypothetical protein AB8C02_00490 [Halioglobus sp.]
MKRLFLSFTAKAIVSAKATIMATMTVTALAGCSDANQATTSNLTPAIESTSISKAEEPKNAWVKTSVSHNFEGRTVALEVSDTVYFFHRNLISIYTPATNTWEHREQENPYLVDGQFAATYDQAGAIYLLTGKRGIFQRLNIATHTFETLTTLPGPVQRGPRIESDGKGFIYAAAGYNEERPAKGTLLRYNVAEDAWEAMGKIKTVNAIGRYSSGLSYWEDKLYAWGDHHVSALDLTEHQWGKKIFWPMRYRPALGRGGMYTIDREAGAKYVTLGRGSNSLGMLGIRDKGFYYLRPRLPFFLEEDDDTLFLSQVNGEKRLNVLANSERAIYSINVDALETIVSKSQNNAADVGSPWTVHNVVRRGAGGELIRHKDSFTNIVYAPPFVYNHRKNILRRFNLKTGRHSWVGGCCGPHGKEFKFHKKFIASGAGIAYDDERYFYLFTGHDQKFFQVDLWGGEKPGKDTKATNGQAKAEDLLVSELAALPEQPASNTAFAYHEGALWAVFDPNSRKLYRYDLTNNIWQAVANIPEAAVYDSEYGFVLTSTDNTLFLAAKDTLYSYEDSQRWEAINKFNFSFYADGGMLAYDKGAKRFFVSVGGATTSLGIVDPNKATSDLHTLEFPDVVSVAGQRMFIDDERLFIVRGHNSAEIWRTPLSVFE